MADKVLIVPGSPAKTKMKHGSDRVWVIVQADINWSYTDSNPPCFPNGFLPTDCYLKTNPCTAYGPYVATRGGTLQYVEAPGPCDPQNPGVIVAGTQHTITVS
jgi:hypothetical protein